MTLTKEQKNELLNLIKNINLNEAVIRDDSNLKWYKFGAYDALKIVSEAIGSVKEDKSE